MRDLISSLQSMRDRLTPVLAEKFGDSFDGDMDTLLDAINHLKRTAQPPHQDRGEVEQRARELLAAEYRTHGWHEDAGRLCMGGDTTTFVEDDALRVVGRLLEEGDEDSHVITELGRLLAQIAVTLKGPEPAGTAWSYHDLPAMVAALTEAKQQGPGEADWVLMPRDRIAALPILHALADAAEMERLPDPGNADDAYPITGDQSTVWQWYKAMLAAAPQVEANAVTDAEVDVAIARLFATHRNDEEKREVAGYAQLIASAYYGKSQPQVEAKRQAGEGAAEKVISSVVRAIQKARNVADGAAACHAQGAQHQAGMRRACNIIEEAISAISSEVRP